MIKKCMVCNGEILDSYKGHGEVDVFSLEMEYKHSICPRCALWGFKPKQESGFKFDRSERKCKVCGKDFIPNSANAVACPDECRTVLDKQYHIRSERKRRNKKNDTNKTCKGTVL